MRSGESHRVSAGTRNRASHQLDESGLIGTKARGWSLTTAIGYMAGQSALSHTRTGHPADATDDIGEDLDAIEGRGQGKGAPPPAAR